MRNLMRAGLCCAALLAGFLGSGVAGAVNEYQGMTLEEAVGRIGEGNYVITSRIGEYLPTEKCIVSSSRIVQSPQFKAYLNLNCNDVSAFNGHAGNSAVTPEGKEVALYRRAAVEYSKGFAAELDAGQTHWCASNADNCKYVCEKGGTCSDQLLEFLGSL